MHEFLIYFLTPIDNITIGGEKNKNFFSKKNVNNIDKKKKN